MSQSKEKACLKRAFGRINEVTVQSHSVDLEEDLTVSKRTCLRKSGRTAFFLERNLGSFNDVEVGQKSSDTVVNHGFSEPDRDGMKKSSSLVEDPVDHRPQAQESIKLEKLEKRSIKILF